VLVCMEGRWFFWGVVVLSLLPLARPNYMIFPVWAAVVLVVMARWRRMDLASATSRRRLIAAAALFCVPLFVWTIRNYTVTGSFPVVLSKAGEDVYGTYNSLTATVGGPHYGRWVPASLIPGEEPEPRMATKMSEVELSRYYQAKGLRFIRDRWKAIPALVVGRVIFAAAPQWPPFGATPTGSRYSSVYRILEWIFRIALYVTAAMLLWRRSVKLESWYGVILTSTFLTTATTVLLYYGWERFLYQLTILLVPLVCSTGVKRLQDPQSPVR
jgi:hypothetical protein